MKTCLEKESSVFITFLFLGNALSTDPKAGEPLEVAHTQLLD